MNYYTMTTDAGDEALAKYAYDGTQTIFSKMAVGDGGGTYYEPAKTQTALRNEVFRGDPVVERAADNPKRITVTLNIPAETGGFTVREAGLFASDGTMLVVAKLPLSEKVSPESGASSDLVIRLYIEVSDANAVTITVDSSLINASKKDVADAKTELQGEINGKADKSSLIITTIPASDWTGTDAPYTQTISVAGVTATSANEILPGASVTADQLEALQEANLQDGGQAEGSITVLAYGDKPDIDLPVRIIVRGDL